MSEYQMNKDGMIKGIQMNDLSEFVQAYIEAMFWTSEDDRFDVGTGITSEDGFSDLHYDTLQTIIQDCNKFQEQAKTELELAYDSDNYDEAQAGHDFWLTRNHHGAGFWDRKELEISFDETKDVGKTLTDIAHSFGEIDLYKGDDGIIYF